MSIDLFGTLFELAGRPELVVTELKVGVGAAREALTELLGYAQGLGGIFPGLSRADVIHVLVAPMSKAQAIVRLAVASQLAFDSRSILVLEPAFDTPVPGDLRLKLWLPGAAEFGLLQRMAFESRNMTVARVSWGGDPDKWPPDVMLAIAQRVAIRMESLGIHGYAFASQVDAAAKFPYSNIVTCVGVNPFNVALEMFSIEQGWPPTSQVSGLPLSALIPGLKRSKEVADDVDSSRDSWGELLKELAWDVVAKSIRSPNEEFSESIEPEILPLELFEADYRRFSYETDVGLAASGLLRQLFEEVVEEDYRYMAANNGSHPMHGDPPPYSDEMLRSMIYFNAFVQRMRTPGGSMGEMLREFLEGVKERRQTAAPLPPRPASRRRR